MYLDWPTVSYPIMYGSIIRTSVTHSTYKLQLYQQTDICLFRPVLGAFGQKVFHFYTDYISNYQLQSINLSDTDYYKWILSRIIKESILLTIFLRLDCLLRYYWENVDSKNIPKFSIYVKRQKICQHFQISLYYI